jgi:hypothetical protein
MSASESNCSPSGLATLNKRAKNPSKKSKKIPKQTNRKALKKSLSEIKTSATHPHDRFSKVIAFGIYFSIVIF